MQMFAIFMSDRERACTAAAVPLPCCRRMHDYLVATGRSGAAALADAFK
jgi:hypothetical protein